MTKKNKSMNKKTKISLNSTLIEAVMSKTIAVQEQSYVKDKILSGDYNPSSANYQVQSNFDKKQREAVKKAYNDFMYQCEKYREKAKKMARRIVNMEFDDWTPTDTAWYDKYSVEGAQPCTMINKRNWNMSEWIEWVENDEPGLCAKWHHCVLPVLEFASLALAAVPVVGWAGALAVSAGIGLLDGALYISEGNEELGGLVMFLSVLPVVPSVVKKFPFVKEWGKAGAKKIAAKIVAGKTVSKLEQYQIKWLTTEASQKFIEVEVKKQLIKESVALNLRKGVIEGIEQYTVKQQPFIIKFAKFTGPMVAAGYTYFQIYDAVAKTGVMGPKDLIRKLWKKEPDDKALIKVSKFFSKVADPDGELDDYETNWDFIRAMFKASGSGTDGELMVQAIKAGWTPYEEGKMLVPKKYRTRGYKKWVNEILSVEGLLKYFKSDGSEKDNELLLQWVFAHLDYTPAQLATGGADGMPEEYHTETMKEFLKKREAGAIEDEDIKLRVPWDD